ncbi:hypothetical protein [Halobacillus amylolyticus]|nr:hypothetical protein [Halobacillus amylolyticus]
MATFEHSVFLELGISGLEQLKVPSENILAVPLNKRTEKGKLLDSIHQSDGISLFDLAAALATACSVIGASVGFHLGWGPIIWGIIGAISGFVLAFLINILTAKVKHDRQRKVREKTSELILIVHCESHQVEKVEKILWDNLAFGVAILDNEDQSI